MPRFNLKGKLALERHLYVFAPEGGGLQDTKRVMD